MLKVVKKDGTLEDYQEQKIINACEKASSRALDNLKDEDYSKICNRVYEIILEENFVEDEENNTIISVYDMHNIVERVLEELYPNSAHAYQQYRNYKMSFVHMMDDVYKKSQSIRFIGDKDNANTDSALVATKRCLIFNELNRELYKNFFMTKNELQAAKDGYIYIHDQSARLDTINCDLFRIGTVMKDGFEMGNVWYNEPNSLDTAFDVMGDIILSTASQQYGGFTVPQVDKILAPYAEKSYKKYYEEYINNFDEIFETVILKDVETDSSTLEGLAQSYARKKVKRDFEQGWQGIEYKLNTVGSSRGDYPFVTMTFGLDTSEFGKMASITFLNVHKNGQGKEGCKIPVLFPKLVFLYDENLHGPGCVNEDVFEAGIECSSKTMYPDWLSLTGEGYVSEMYKKYGKVVSPMGCVDGKEIIRYIYKDNLYRETFEQMWSRINKDIKDTGQNSTNDVNRLIDLRNYDIKIFDTMKGFTKVKFLIRNIQSNWCKVKFSNGKSIICTTDHPFHTMNRGRVFANQLNLTDTIAFSNDEEININNIINNYNIVNITFIKLLNKLDYSYDVTTESDHFTVSGMYSHNCRAFLSPWYERGGMEPADENDTPVFEGRFNLGVVSLHLPMILAKARRESTDFYKVLDYYLELIRNLHKRTYDYLGELKASVNPVAFCEGGLYGGHLKPNEKIKSILKPMTLSFGITALNELQVLYNSKSIVEDGNFALEVMEYINNKITEFKKEDGLLYAIYGTPAETLAGLQVKQFRSQFGIVDGVSSRAYVSNSFHCGVWEDITPIEKQDLEERFWNYFNGGKIQYCRYPVSYNIEAIKTLIRRAMKKGFYEGVNLELSYCEECGYEQLEMDVCPKCGSTSVTKISRMNGYLGYTRKHNETRYNDSKYQEISERVSM